MRPAQPLLPEDSAVLSVFPPRWWAALLPAFVGVLVTTSVLGYIGWVLVTSQLTRYVCTCLAYYSWLQRLGAVFDDS